MRSPEEITINGKQLSDILSTHKKWILDEVGERANLYGADLYEANLYGANLYGANLYGANLRGANLRVADLYEANLYGADLRRADLYEANLYGANLADADLRRADLYGANLRRADLRGANLYEANLRGADLRRADLYGAENVELAAALTTIVPEGTIIGWKKLSGGKIAKLEIPAEARRSNATGRKCRAEFAKVLEIWDGENPVPDGVSKHDVFFTYRVGEIATPDKWDENRWEECAGGIHFFITRREAEDY